MGKEIIAITPDGEKHTLLTEKETPEPITGDFVEIDGKTMLVEKRVFIWKKGKMIAYLKHSDK